MRYVMKILVLILSFTFIYAIYGCSLTTTTESTSTTTPRTFAQSKAAMQKAFIAQDFHREFYCGVDFNPRTLKILPSSQYTPRKALTSKGKPNPRTERIEFEHIMSAHRFGSGLECWKNGGRKACSKDKTFIAMESDRRNLVPAIGEINGDRSNFAYAEADSKQHKGQYGKCAVFVDFKAKRFYPNVSERGIIARIYLYMSKHYDIKLSDEELALMQKWDRLYPPTTYEKQLLKVQQSP